ncbi:MAG: S41 family peptidase [Candidatus Gastranaerophilales bacterium]|nr:S41 family peptidase [Candidatus Gastranaerophilales bacterium]
MKKILITITIFSLMITNAFSYSPTKLYDDVWVLVDAKYVDQNICTQDWTKWRHKYDNKIQNDADAKVAIETMLASLNDPYTRYLDIEEFKDENDSIKGSLKGIGVQIGIKDEKLTVIAPMEDTPAAKAGLQANDVILQIDGHSTKGITVKEAADKIRGPEGTYVKLLIKRGETEKNYEIVRQNIQLKSVSTTTPDNIKIPENMGYIRLSTFINKNAYKEVADALAAQSKKQGYILDLRSNPGGLLTNAIIISDMFLKGGKIVSTVDRDGYKETQRASDEIITNKPIVVIINGGSASASEILSGALKDNKRATLVGTKTFGKGVVQEINKLPDGSGINITTQKYLTPNGTDIHKKGIEPDIEVQLSEEDIKAKKDPQLMKATQTLNTLIQQMYGKTCKAY